MTCIIFGDAFTFPEGDASTNRVYTYARGLLENGTGVSVVCFRNSYGPDYSGVSEGIRFYHPFNRRIRSSSFIMRRVHSASKYLKTFSLFRNLCINNRETFIICYTKSLSTQLYAFLLSRIFGLLLVLERSEHPYKDYRSKTALKVKGSIKVAIEIRFTDLIFCISDYLKEFYSLRGAAKKKLHKVPSTVDTERFVGSFARPIERKYICYCGSLTLVKDGVDILIKSYAELAYRFGDVDLALVGKADTATEAEFFTNLVSSLGLNERVHFTGKLSRNDIPAFLCHAEILTLARPKSIVADAGFPSKVTEYLATGRPVVVTAVGEIPDYLSDGENAYIAEPGNITSFSDKMKYVLENYNQALEAGRKGREIAFSVFNYNVQAKEIIQLIKSMR